MKQIIHQDYWMEIPKMNIKPLRSIMSIPSTCRTKMDENIMINYHYVQMG